MKYWVLGLLLMGLFWGRLLPPLRAQDAVINTGLDGVNLRAAPSLAAGIVTVLRPDMALDLLRVSADGQWLHLTTDAGISGWAYRDLITVQPEAMEAVLALNRVPLTDVVSAHVAALFRAGQGRGLRADRFAKVGDSISVSDHWLVPISAGFVNTADYRSLEPVIAHFGGGSSAALDPFGRVSLATGIGWNTGTLLDPAMADSAQCAPTESPITCEYRVMQPALALIMIGTNDVGFMEVALYRAHLVRILEVTLAQSIIPILTTIPPRNGFDARVTAFNAIITDLGRAYELPVIDYYGAMAGLPLRGLDLDGVHPNIPPKGFEGAVDFRPYNLNFGYVQRNLITLQMLETLLAVFDAPQIP